MRPRNRLARLARAISGETQKDFADKTGVHHTLLAQYENGQVEPGPENLERLAHGAGFTVADGEEILRLADTLRRSRERAGQGDAELLQQLLAAQASHAYQRLLRLPPPETEDRPADDELWSRLRDLSEKQALTVVRLAREFQRPALAERLREESEREASRDAGRAAFLARLAGEVLSRTVR
jgi:transcriptional regulator with XRE-family HTH domain